MTPFLFIAVFPIYWMVITAFKQESDLYRMGNSRSGSTCRRR